jgi:hypothetical protein
MSLSRTIASLVAISSLGCWRLSISTEHMDEPANFQFAISVDSGVRDPVYVLRRTTTDQPGWIEVFNDNQRVYLLERCDIEICGQNSGVCGQTVPFIENLTSPKSSGSIVLDWDRYTSKLDSTLGCEIRTKVKTDNLHARFCYSPTAEIEGEWDDEGAGEGRLIGPICLQKEFSLSEENLILKIGPNGLAYFDQ